VTVRDGWITLEGEIEWDFLRKRSADVDAKNIAVETGATR
jgi:hypothetical protein